MDAADSHASTTMAGVGEDAKPPPSIAERRKGEAEGADPGAPEGGGARRRGAGGQAGARHARGAGGEPEAAGEELDWAEDAEAWAAAHPPKKFPEARVAYFRDVAESVTDDDLDDELMLEEGLRRMPDEVFDGVRKRLVESRSTRRG